MRRVGPSRRRGVTTLITGATGFVGRPIVDYLIADGETVRVLIPPGLVVPHEWRDRVSVSVGELRDPDSLPPAVRGVTAVYHLAGELRDSTHFTSVNVEGTRNLLAASAEEGRVRVLHMSSVGVIGARRRGEYDEDSACQPRSPYEVSKLRGEEIARDFGRRGDLAVTVVRPTIVFGPRLEGPSDSFLSWLRAIKLGRFRFVGSAPAVANYVFVEDVAAACVHLARAYEAVGETYHIADPCTIEELVLEAARVLGVEAPGRLPRAAAYGAAAACEALGSALRFAPPLTLGRVRALTSSVKFSGEKLRRAFQLPFGWREGVRRTVQAYQRAGRL